MKASRRLRIRSHKGGRLSVSPALQVWLDASEGELRFAEMDIRQYPGPHERFNRFRSKEEKRLFSVYDTLTDAWNRRLLSVHLQ